MDATKEPLGQGLIYEDMLPLRWRTVDVPYSTLELARLQESNEEVLRIIAVLDEHSSDGGEEHTPLNQEILRIETKLNLLLSLVGQIFTLHYPQPQTRPVKLTPVYIEWMTSDGVQPDEYGLVELYLSPRCPRPLVFPGKVAAVEAVAGGYSIRVKFAELNDVLKERLEKIIFRHHRRSVALARRRPPAN